MTFRDRCKAFYQSMQTNALLRQSSPVDDLMAFVMSEQGRAADITLKEPEKNQWFKCIWETSGKDWQLRVDEISGTWSELLKGYE